MIVMNDFHKEYESQKQLIDQAIASVLESGWYILGSAGEAFEREFASYIGTAHAIGVANGMQAIQISLLAAGVRSGDEVITTPLSAIETTFAITAIGAKPVFVDIDSYFHMDAQRVRAAITTKTKAFLPVHLYGQAVDLRKLMSLSKTYQIPVIEDACQGHGATFDGKSVGSFGLAGAFSFYPTKNLGAYGDGGMITTNDESFAQKCRLLRNAGRIERYKHAVQGLNSRLDELQAAILSAKLPLLDQHVKKRRERASWYSSILEHIPGIEVPRERDGAMHSYHLYVVRAKERDRLQQFLKQQEIESFIHFPIPIPYQPCFSEFRGIQVPVTEHAVTEILSLPIHPFLEQKEVERVAQAISAFYTRT